MRKLSCISCLKAQHLPKYKLALFSRGATLIIPFLTLPINYMDNTSTRTWGKWVTENDWKESITITTDILQLYKLFIIHSKEQTLQQYIVNDSYASHLSLALTLFVGQQEEHPDCKKSCFINPKDSPLDAFGGHSLTCSNHWKNWKSKVIYLKLCIYN